MDARPFFFILLISGILAAFPVDALGGYTVAPAADIPGQEYHDFEEISFFEESPRMMLIELALFFSPALVVPAEILYSLFFISSLGFRRITRQTVLDHEQRRVIYETVGDSPGISLRSLREKIGMAEGTARYHLDLLVRHGLIASHCRYGFTRYYVNNGAYGRPEHVLLTHLHNENDRRIIDLLTGSDGKSHRDLMAATGTTSSSISWHMKRLVADGIVQSERNGKINSYQLTHEAANTLEILNAGGMPETEPCGAGSTAGSG